MGTTRATITDTSVGKERSERRPAHRRILAAAVLAVSTIAVMNLSAGGIFTGSASAAPGTPGVPQAGVPVFTEDFSNVDASAAPIAIGGYTGGPASGAMTYSADAAWSPGAFACNGWVLRSGTPVPVLVAVPAPNTNDQCDRNNAMAQLGNMALAIGQFQGQGAVNTNQVLSAFTNSVSGVQAAGYELTTNGSIAAAGGRFYAVSAIFGEANCGVPGAPQASQTFELIIDGTPTALGTGLNPCDNPDQIISQVRIKTLQSAAIKTPSGTVNLGLRVYNATAAGAGNDVAFDLPQIVDVTPQLDKAFSASTISFGTTSTLTFTVTNTDDLQAKDGWSFNDTLPAGVTATGTNSTTCDSGTVTAIAGATTVASTGNLAVGETSCTITVQVTASAPGTYVNTGCIDPAGAVISGCVSNISADGITPPGSATLIVNPVIDAVDDPYGLQTPGATTGSVLANDTANTAAATLVNVTLTPGVPSNSTLTMHADGTITVGTNTPPGSYTYPYTICLVSSPTTCDAATATLSVTSVINAVDDPFGTQTPGATTPTVITNDTLNGNPAVIGTGGNVILTPGVPSNPGLTMNANGTITVGPTTPTGTYTYPYTICSIVDPAICDTATATLNVVNVIDAVDNPFGIQTPGATTGTVITNDTLNNRPATVGTSGNVTLTPGVPSNTGLHMNADGTITVAASTPPGSYTYPYTICSTAQPALCDTAVATLTVEATADAGAGAPGPTPTPTALPTTGTDSSIPLRLAATMLLVGFGAMFVSRRRRPA